MKRIALIGFLATASLAAIPAASFAQNVDAGCPRAYYKTTEGCIPNTQGRVGPEYGNVVTTEPGYYQEAPAVDVPPRYYHRRHVYVVPEGE